MKLIHLTAKRFESLSADNIYIANLANQFSKILGPDYLLVVGSMAKGQFQGINTINLNLLSWGTGLAYFLLPYLFYFFWLPYFLLFKINTSNQTTFFLSDPNLLWAIIVWRKVLSRKFRITSDWHMLHNDWRDKFISRNSDSLITTSKKLENLLLGIGAPRDKIKTVYGGVDLDEFKNQDTLTREKFNLPIDKKLIGYIGLFKTMGMEKGLDTMIKSLKFLSQDFCMVFVGGKDKEISEYQAFSKKEGIAGRCIFIGKIMNHQEVCQIEKIADVLVIPYPDKPHFRNYGFPMKVYEYMAAEKPIVYSKLDLTEEVLADCGFTFIPEDPKNLAETLEYAFRDKNKEEVSKKVALAYEKVKNLTWESKAKAILEFHQRYG